MPSKMTFLVGLGAGYVLGTRAGRAQYERIKATASSVAQSPSVRSRVEAVQDKLHDVVRQQGEVVTDKVAQAVKDRLFGNQTAGTKQPIDVGEATVQRG
ncbi:protoporphyrinogen oxidase [Actinomyces vulturis]|uniref:protoporphyrinogen oxidase n=1 Tax=Actinomyces vulturis TaxID=1857645 RepID=UPI00082BD1E9|nr:protoporphyrinogen oxidase [Actinomyces vulturis]